MNNSLNYINNKYKMLEYSDNENDEVLIGDEHDFNLINIETNEKDNEKENICNNYTFAMVILLIETIISLGIFYICYLVEFVKINLLIQRIMMIPFFAIYLFIPCFIGMKFISNHKICGNIILFILISINKIIIYICIHLVAVSYSNKILEFPNFEAKFYWKASICLFYIFLIFFNSFRKNSIKFGIFYYISFSSISLLSMFLLIFFRNKNEDKWEIEGFYLLLSALEIVLAITSIYIEKYIHRNNTPCDFEFNKLVLWKINRIDLFRYYYIIVSLIYSGFKMCCIMGYSDNRCFYKFINNFSLPSDKRTVFTEEDE